MGTAQKSMMAAITHLPPILSVRTPIGSLIRAPTKTGTPNKNPIWTEFQVNNLFSTRKVTNTPLIIHAAKHTVNAIVLRNRMRCDLGLISILYVIRNLIQPTLCLLPIHLGIIVIFELIEFDISHTPQAFKNPTILLFMPLKVIIKVNKVPVIKDYLIFFYLSLPFTHN